MIATEELKHSRFFSNVIPASQQEDHQGIDFFVGFAQCATPTICDERIGVQFTYTDKKDETKFGVPRTVEYHERGRRVERTFPVLLVKGSSLHYKDAAERFVDKYFHGDRQPSLEQFCIPENADILARLVAAQYAIYLSRHKREQDTNHH